MISPTTRRGSTRCSPSTAPTAPGTRMPRSARCTCGPVLNLKQELEVKKMRAIAEEAFAIVREYKGSHSGEHGDGIVRSEFHEPMFGARIVRAFEEVKDTFDPAGLLNPGKIVRAAARWTTARCSATRRATRRKSARLGARLVGVGRLRRRRRDVQQQRRLPQDRSGRDVPVLPRHLRRAASDARARQHAAPRARRASSARDALASDDDARDHGALRLVQGLQARMSGRRRHGADEDRVPGSVSQDAPLSLRERLVAYLPRYAP